MRRDDQPTRTHVNPANPDTATFAPVSRGEFLATVTRGIERPLADTAPFQFAAGRVLANRYRIVAALGRGGMGEVYRADDLTLGNSVALKFLPEQVATNPRSLERFRKEVAAARQVAHPHVCRVFDIGEADGQVFLSMEFIPGDDLANVIQCVGRLSSDLAIDLFRQIAQGLQAIHDEGLIHRDLKPANVMIDGRGRARITDFGLATSAESIVGLDAFSGTPTYQAPEQLVGGMITERSDVYALGVLAYELLTGRRPFVPADRTALIQSQQKQKPAAPSTFDPTIPPEVDRIVLKCLAPDPLRRPTSAHEVWRSLPGDAALNAALAAGVTPSAEVVADAGGEGRLTRRTALLLAVTSLVFVVLTGLMQFTTFQQGQELDLNPDELRDRCRSFLTEAGHPGDVPFTTSDYEVNAVQLAWRDEHDRGMDRLAPEASRRFSRATFFYRVSPTPLIPALPIREQPIVTADNPPFGSTGSALLVVDGQGQLVHLTRLPTAVRSQTPPQSPDWPAWFRSAGFDIAQFQPTEPSREWTVPHDTRFAWKGVFPERPSIPVTIEAATDRGELVAFTRVAPWTPPESQVILDPVYDNRYQLWWVLVPTAMLLVGSWLAYRQVRAGTADVVGALRFAVGFSCLHLLMYVLWCSRLNPSGREFTDAYTYVALVAMNAVRLTVGYLALEPFVRRRWPWQLIGWRRLLAGRWNDPRVGRDVLIGTVAGIAVAVLQNGWTMAPAWLGLPPELPAGNLGLGAVPVPMSVALLLTSVDSSIVVLFLLFAFSRLLRTPWLWVPVLLTVLVFGAFGVASGANPDILRWLSPTIALIAIVLLRQFGLLTLIVAWLTALVTIYYPIFYGWNTWFWQASALVWTVILSLIGYGLVMSVGGWQQLVNPPRSQSEQSGAAPVNLAGS